MGKRKYVLFWLYQTLLFLAIQFLTESQLILGRLPVDYITADIEGNVKEKRRKLKKGALWAVGIVSLLYVSFNLFLVSDSSCARFFN